MAPPPTRPWEWPCRHRSAVWGLAAAPPRASPPVVTEVESRPARWAQGRAGAGFEHHPGRWARGTAAEARWRRRLTRRAQPRGADAARPERRAPQSAAEL